MVKKKGDYRTLIIIVLIVLVIVLGFYFFYSNSNIMQGPVGEAYQTAQSSPFTDISQIDVAERVCVCDCGAEDDSCELSIPYNQGDNCGDHVGEQCRCPGGPYFKKISRCSDPSWEHPDIKRASL